MAQNKKHIAFFILLLLVVASQAFCQKKFSVEFLPGISGTAHTNLTIHQEGFPDLKFKANYEEASLKPPIYYSVRVAYLIGNKSRVELEMNHLKIYLQNNPPEVQVFSISHGYNQFWVNYANDFQYFTGRVGLGPVVAHRENTVRGEVLPETGGFFNHGYHLDGITGQLAVSKRIYPANWCFLNFETKANLSYSKVDVVNGYAKVPVVAFALLVGFGFEL